MTRLAEGRLRDIDGKKETEAVPMQTTRRVDTEAPNVPATMDGQAAAMEWQIVERRRKSKKATAEEQPARTTAVSGLKNPRKAPERRTETAEKRGDKSPLPRTPRTSAVTITTKEGSAQSYVEVLAFARGSIPLAKVGGKALKMRIAMTGGVILELAEDQKGEKAAALAAHLTRILDPSKVRVVVPFRAAEARVIGIDISVTKGEIRDTLAKEGGCKAEDVQLGEVRSARNGLGSVWMRGPARAVRILTQTGKVPIGWSTAKIEAIARWPLQCYQCLEIGHVKRTCNSKEDRGHLCYRCGGPGHRAIGCTAANPELCEALWAPSAHRMGRPVCAPPRKETRRRATRGYKW